MDEEGLKDRLNPKRSFNPKNLIQTNDQKLFKNCLAKPYSQ